MPCRAVCVATCVSTLALIATFPGFIDLKGTPSDVICRGWCLPIFSVAPRRKPAFCVKYLRGSMCVRTSREPVPDAQHPTRTRSWPLPRALAAPASCPERFLPARGPTERWVGAVGRISRHAQIRAALRPERGGSVGPCQHPLRKPLKTARKELPTPASWGKEGRSVGVFRPKRAESLVAICGRRRHI